jgi:Uma2 family endonuclease
LKRRALVKLRPDTEIRPDLTLIRRNDPRLYLAVEVLQHSDRHPDTVIKKNILAACLVPRLWIVDGRYQNIEIYVTNGGRFRLESILTGNDLLSDAALCGSRYSLSELFARRKI